MCEGIVILDELVKVVVEGLIIVIVTWWWRQQNEIIPLAAHQLRLLRLPSTVVDTIIQLLRWYW